MQEHTLVFVALIALLSGCGNKGSETPQPARTSLAANETSKATEAHASAQTSLSPPQSSVTLPATSPAPELATLAIGEKVYKSTCSICHKSGLNGAPRMGSSKAWEPRIAQGKEVLYQHSINGFRGSKGSMPSRGSNPRLSEAEVKAAVDYIVENAIPSWSIE